MTIHRQPPFVKPASRTVSASRKVAMLLELGLLISTTSAFASRAGSDAPRSPSQANDDLPVRACGDPGQVLNLKDWKLTVPLPNPVKQTDAAWEVREPELASFRSDPWFVVVPGCDGVQFRAPVNGVTTKGSKYPRTELREMADGGRVVARWSSNVGTHTMTIKEAVTHSPQSKPVVVTAQIHGADGDVSTFRLEGRKLYITKGSESRYKLVTAAYVPGTVFEAKYVVSNDQVKAYYNDTLQATIDGHFTDAYFKAGAYTQANCSNASPCSSDNYGEVVIHSLDVTHE